MHNSALSDRPAELSDNKRALSAIAGSLLIYFVTKKHKGDSLLLLAGGYFLYRAVSGHCPVTTAVKTMCSTDKTPAERKEQAVESVD